MVDGHRALEPAQKHQRLSCSTMQLRRRLVKCLSSATVRKPQEIAIRRLTMCRSCSARLLKEGTIRLSASSKASCPQSRKPSLNRAASSRRRPAPACPCKGFCTAAGGRHAAKPRGPGRRGQWSRSGRHRRGRTAPRHQEPADRAVVRDRLKPISTRLKQGLDVGPVPTPASRGSTIPPSPRALP